MSDFEDDGFDPFGPSADEVPVALRPLGLVVPVTARQLFDSKGRLLWDELPELERAFRRDRDGRPEVLFSEEDTTDPALREAWRPMS